MDVPAGTSTNPKRLVRLLSFDSTASSVIPQDVALQRPEWKYSFKSPDFLIKLAEIMVAVICAGLYSKAILLMKYSITSLMFPNIVFVSFLIITSVIAISYVLGHVMPYLLMRIFNILGCLLYFISGCITTHVWIITARHEAEEGGIKEVQANMLLAQGVLSFFNAFLYGFDVFLNLKSVWREMSK